MNFWEVHGVLFLIFMALFPRLTMLFATAVSFGLLAWIGWFFCPYLVAAIYATMIYWDTNPIICIIAWLFAIIGTFGEGKAAQKTMEARS